MEAFGLQDDIKLAILMFDDMPLRTALAMILATKTLYK